MKKRKIAKIWSLYDFILDFGKKRSIFNKFLHEFIEHEVSNDNKGKPCRKGKLKRF